MFAFNQRMTPLCWTGMSAGSRRDTPWHAVTGSLCSLWRFTSHHCDHLCLVQSGFSRPRDTLKYKEHRWQKTMQTAFIIYNVYIIYTRILLYIYTSIEHNWSQLFDIVHHMFFCSFRFFLFFFIVFKLTFLSRGGRWLLRWSPEAIHLRLFCRLRSFCCEFWVSSFFFQRASELWSWTSAALASLLRKCRSPSDTKSYTSFSGSVKCWAELSCMWCSCFGWNCRNRLFIIVDLCSAPERLDISVAGRDSHLC